MAWCNGFREGGDDGFGAEIAHGGSGVSGGKRFQGGVVAGEEDDGVVVAGPPVVGIGGSEEADLRHLESVAKMQGEGIHADEEVGTPDQFGEVEQGGMGGKVEDRIL